MTYKEKVKEIDPYTCGELYSGGVAGCPGDYFVGAPNMSIGTCIMPDVETSVKCTLCWNRLYKGEQVYEEL